MRTIESRLCFNALPIVVFMKQKRDGRIKTRNCVNGSPQRNYIKKEDAASPTVGIDNVFTTGAINAHEGRDVMTFDIPGAFVTTKRVRDYGTPWSPMRNNDMHRSKAVSKVHYKGQQRKLGFVCTIV